MCNPRRVHVRATRELGVAWEREVERAVEVVGPVSAEARVRSPVGRTLGEPVLRALEAALAAGFPGWSAVEGGYRCDVPGGYALYVTGERALEVVATAEGQVSARGVARTVVSGRVEGTVEVEAEKPYYEDGFAGRTRERAEQEAEADVARQVEAHGGERAAAAAREAEAAAAAGVEARAREDAQRRLADAAAARRDELEREARRHLTEVGTRARQAFHRLLGRAYRDAVLELARSRGATDVQVSDTDGVLEIELRLPG